MPSLAGRVRLLEQTLELWLSGQFRTRIGDLKQVESVEPHTGLRRPVLKTRRAHVQRPQRPLKPPLARVEKPGHWAVLRHGTDEIRPPPVAEQVIGAFPRICSGRSQELTG